MLSKTVFLALFVLYGAVATATAFPSSEGDKGLERLELIGQVGRKRFFVPSDNEELTWEDAKSQCEASGMKLAAVETLEEETFLQKALSDRFAASDVSHYWTSGRDALARQQFVWDTTGEELNNIGEVGTYVSPYTCLTFRVPDYDTLWKQRYCTDVWPALCQLNSI